MWELSQTYPSNNSSFLKLADGIGGGLSQCCCLQCPPPPHAPLVPHFPHCIYSLLNANNQLMTNDKQHLARFPKLYSDMLS